MESRENRLLLSLLILVAMVTAILVAEGWTAQRRQDRSRDFQELVGGMGFGPAVNLSDCAFGFDPRLDGACGEDSGPVPGVECFCPRHAGSLFPYEPVAGQSH
jgi:hypothetical protein